MSEQEPFIVALSGGSGSGKSTLSDALVDRLGREAVVLFHEDAYYWPRDHYPVSMPASAINYDHPESKDTEYLIRDLTHLRAGETIEQPIYDYASHDRSSTETRRISPAKVVLLEGIHALSIPGTDHLIDLKVYVDTPDDLRLARRIRRDVAERGRELEGVLSQYMNTVRPAHYAHTFPAKFVADLVIADEGLPAFGDVRPSEVALERMVSPVLERLRSAGVI
ncbi:MAG: uridine kinase [Pseudomonadota bacterium]